MRIPVGEKRNMFEKLNNQLLEIKEKIRIKQRLESQIGQAKEKLSEERAKLGKLSAVLKKEEADVQKLEGLSLTAMFNQILGSKDQKLNKEKQEFLAAKLKYDQCQHSVISLEREISYRERQIEELGDPDTQYAFILKQKESLILEGENKQLAQISELLAGLNSDIKELKEAITAGKTVLDKVETVISQFKSAGNWGVADLIGGGIIVTAVKHSKIDKAKAAVHDVQHLLGRFQRELSDLQVSPGSRLAVEISSFQTFADYIFDGLIFDWVVQSKIKKSLDKALDMKTKMLKIIDNLQIQLKIRQQKKRKAEAARKNLIEKM